MQCYVSDEIKWIIKYHHFKDDKIQNDLVVVNLVVVNLVVIIIIIIYFYYLIHLIHSFDYLTFHWCIILAWKWNVIKCNEM